MKKIPRWIKFLSFYISGLLATGIGLTLLTSNVPFLIVYAIAISFFMILPVLFRKNQKAVDALMWTSIVASSITIILGINFWAKAFYRQYGTGDAKMYLSLLHKAQLDHKKTWGQYADDLTKLEVQPFQGKTRYFFGLSKQCSTKKHAPLVDVPQLIDKSLSVFDCIDPTMKEKFEIFALRDLGTDKLDIWKINQDKILVRVQDGRVPLGPYSMFDF